MVRAAGRCTCWVSMTYFALLLWLRLLLCVCACLLFPCAFRALSVLFACFQDVDVTKLRVLVSAHIKQLMQELELPEEFQRLSLIAGHRDESQYVTRVSFLPRRARGGFRSFGLTQLVEVFVDKVSANLTSTLHVWVWVWSLYPALQPVVVPGTRPAWCGTCRTSLAKWCRASCTSSLTRPRASRTCRCWPQRRRSWWATVRSPVALEEEEEVLRYVPHVVEAAKQAGTRAEERGAVRRRCAGGL